MQGMLEIEGDLYPIYNDGVTASYNSAKAIEEVYADLRCKIRVLEPCEGKIRVNEEVEDTYAGDTYREEIEGYLVGFVDYQYPGQLVYEIEETKLLRVLSMNGVASQMKLVPKGNLKWET